MGVAVAWGVAVALTRISEEDDAGAWETTILELVSELLGATSTCDWLDTTYQIPSTTKATTTKHVTPISRGKRER